MQALKTRPGIHRGGILSLRVEDISPNPVQPRRFFDEAGLRELGADMDRTDILEQPVSPVFQERLCKATRIPDAVAVPFDPERSAGRYQQRLVGTDQERRFRSRHKHFSAQ